MADPGTLVERWLDEQFEEWPVLASEAGVEGFDALLGDFSADAFESRQRSDRRWAAECDRAAADPAAAGLGPAERIDVDLVRSELAGREVMDDWQAWRRDPEVYLGACLGGVFTLFLHRVHPEPELCEHAVSRLRQIPAVLDAARANLDASLAHSLIVERSLRSCQAGIAYARDLVPAEIADPLLRSRVADAGAVAAAALADFAAYLQDLTGRCRGAWAIGEHRYSRLLQQKELLGYGCAGMHRRGEEEWEKLDGEMTALARRIDPDAERWRDVLRALAADHPASPDAMRDAYRQWTAAAREFLARRELVSFAGGERCLVEPSPVFQRPLLAVASYASPPPLSSSVTGHFFVPYPPEGMTAEEIEELLADNNLNSIPTTAVHEAYPGHHWHLTWLRGGTHRVRKVFWSAYFAEGWALYAEKMMREEGFFTDQRHELCHLDARIFRAARMVVDTALHAGEMTVDEAVEFMSTRASLTDAVARAEVRRYCAWPTQAASYLTGSLEIERIRHRYLSEQRGTLRQFHDTIAGTGALPIALAERAVLGAGGPATG